MLVCFVQNGCEQGSEVAADWISQKLPVAGHTPCTAHANSPRRRASSRRGELKVRKIYERANWLTATNYSVFATLLNVPEACWPIEVMAVKQTTIINANITAYSTAVGPSSDTRKRCTFLAKLFIVFSTDVRVTGLGKGIFRYKPITPKGNAYTAFGDTSSEHRVRTRPVSHLVIKPL